LDSVMQEAKQMSDLKRESMEQQVKGAASKAKGRIKEAAGDLAGREDWQAEGEMDQVEGSVRSGVGRAGERVSDALENLKDDAKDDRDR
jgi:uncharacterized protein YjbJ (UPF0337 family)